MPKPLRAGSEIDAYCTKCRMDLLHRIIAMKADKPVRVECRTCGGHHAYHRPKSAAPEPRATRASGTRVAAPSARAEARAAAERARESEWEKRIGGQPLTSFKPYRATQTFASGELIRHGKFGEGYIVRVIDPKKVEVMFKDGPRTLAQALDA
jgi:hypothetical protein